MVYNIQALPGLYQCYETIVLYPPGGFRMAGQAKEKRRGSKMPFAKNATLISVSFNGPSLAAKPSEHNFLGRFICII